MYLPTWHGMQRNKPYECIITTLCMKFQKFKYIFNLESIANNVCLFKFNIANSS